MKNVFFPFCFLFDALLSFVQLSFPFSHVLYVFVHIVIDFSFNKNSTFLFFVIVVGCCIVTLMWSHVEGVLERQKADEWISSSSSKSEHIKESIFWLAVQELKHVTHSILLYTDYKSLLFLCPYLS